jgi:hypothetical protein
MTLADLGAAAVAGVLALVPAALILLALHGAATRLELETRLGRSGYRTAGVATLIAVAVGGILATWAFAGANYLKPRCLAFAAADYAVSADGPVPAIPSAGLVMDAGTPLPPWTPSLTTLGGFAFITWRDDEGAWQSKPAGASQADARALLRVRRQSTRVGAWLQLTTDRFTLTDRLTGLTLAVGDEMWVDAGLARYRCGVASGPLPVRSREYPLPGRLLGFMTAAVTPELPAPADTGSIPP